MHGLALQAAWSAGILPATGAGGFQPPARGDAK